MNIGYPIVKIKSTDRAETVFVGGIQLIYIVHYYELYNKVVKKLG